MTTTSKMTPAELARAYRAGELSWDALKAELVGRDYKPSPPPPQVGDPDWLDYYPSTEPGTFDEVTDLEPMGLLSRPEFGELMAAYLASKGVAYAQTPAQRATDVLEAELPHHAAPKG